MYLTSVPGEEAPDHETHTAAAYLKRLWTYLAALAIAGCEPTDAVPTAAETSYSYHHRAALLTEQLPEPRRLSVLVQLDRAERSEWAQSYTLSPEKDLHWSASIMVPTPPPAPVRADRPPSTPAPGSSTGASQWAKQLRNGVKICQQWQLGTCPQQSEKSCPNGSHQCGALLKSGQVCGSFAH